jgi:hypothetical protein
MSTQRKFILLIFLILCINLVSSDVITSNTKQCKIDTERNLPDQISELYFLSVLKMAYMKQSIDKKITDLGTKISNELKIIYEVKNILLESKNILESENPESYEYKFKTLRDDQKKAITYVVFLCVMLFLGSFIFIITACIKPFCVKL